MNLEKAVENFHKKVMELQEKYQIPGISVAITHDNNIIHSSGSGYADIENKIEVTENTPYRIASLTKTFTSAILLRLVEQGKMDLDKSIREYIPKHFEICEKNKKLLSDVEYMGEKVDLSYLFDGYHYERPDITIRHHLTHTTQGEPGEQYKYNGMVFGFLSLAVDLITEEKFEGLVKRDIIDALNLTQTLTSEYDDSKPDVLKGLAKPYFLNEKKKNTLGVYPQKGLNAGAGIISTVIDLAKFDAAINENQIITLESKEQAFTPTKTSKGKELPYGLGWFVQKHPKNALKLIWHYGNWPKAFSSLIMKIPEKKLTLVLLANSDGLSAKFNLAQGDLLTSPFANGFLEHFV